MQGDEVMGSWVETRRGLREERAEAARVERRLAELDLEIERLVREEGRACRALLPLHEELVDLAEALGDLPRAEAAQIARLDLATRAGASHDALQAEYARLRRLVAGQYRAEPPPRPPVVRLDAHEPPPSLQAAIRLQRLARWADARDLLVELLARSPDDAVAAANRMLCSLHLGDGHRERLTAGRLLPQLPASLTPTVELVGLLCAGAAGDRETARGHALRLAARPFLLSTLPRIPRALLPEGPEELPDLRSVLAALDDLLERTDVDRERLAIDALRACYRTRRAA